MNGEALSIHIHSKQIQRSFNNSLPCHKLIGWTQIPRVLCLRNEHCCLFMSSKEAFRSYNIMIFKCKDISDVPCTGEVVGLSARKLGTIWPFLKCIVVKSFDNVNFSGKNFKFAMLIIKVLPINSIVHGLYFSNLVPRVLSYPSIRSERGRKENLGTRLGWVGENPGGSYFSSDNVFSIWCMLKGCIQGGISVCNYEKFYLQYTRNWNSVFHNILCIFVWRLERNLLSFI